MNDRFISLYMDFADRVSEMSRAVRRKVGAVIVKDDTIVYGYNGTPSGWDNTCEEKIYWNPEFEDFHPDELDSVYPYADSHGRYALQTLPEVLHAESNAISKFAKSPVSSKGATLFTTTAPCIHCAAQIHQAEIAEVYYREEYRDSGGLAFLRNVGITVKQIKKD